MISHISEKPWSDYTEADYSIEQWHAACLIHLHSGAPTSKSQCKLPVKTPNGALNRNGVHAAAAALAGARSPLKASSEQKTSAANALRRYYSQLGEKPPPSLSHQNEDFDWNEFLEHHGVKGMHWGVRKARYPFSNRRHTTRTVYQKPPKHLTDAQLQQRVRRLETEKRYNDLNKRTAVHGEKFAGEVMKKVGKDVLGGIITGAAMLAIGLVLKKKFGVSSETVSALTKK